VIERIFLMRRILAASVLLLTMGAATPSLAFYPWCIAMPNEGGALQCRFTSLPQCNATASGMGGECYQNPRLAYGPPPRAVRNGRPPRNAPNGDWQNNGWDNGGWDNRR
jgi:hypothetical protein